MAATITWGTLEIGPPIQKVKILKSTLTFGPKIKEYFFSQYFSSFWDIFTILGHAAKWMYMYKTMLPRPLFLKRSVRIWHQFLESQGQLGLKVFPRLKGITKSPWKSITKDQINGHVRYWQYLRVVVELVKYDHQSIKSSWRLNIKRGCAHFAARWSSNDK